MARLYLGNLPYQFTDADLGKFVSDNSITFSKAVIAARGTRSLGFGFVTLASEADAAKAAVALNLKEAAGRKIKAEVARPEKPKEPREKVVRTPKEPKEQKEQKPKVQRPREKKPFNGTLSDVSLHVGNLPFVATEEDLKNIFDGFTLKSSKIIMFKGKSKGYGFVEFNTPQEAKKAKDEVEGTQVEGRAIKIEFARPQQPRKPRQPRQEKTATSVSSTPSEKKPRQPRKPRVPVSERVKSKCTVFIGELAFSATEEDVKTALATYKPKTVTIPKRHDNRSKGFAFVDFETEEQAKSALAINDTEIKGRKVRADIAFVKVEVKVEAEKKN